MSTIFSSQFALSGTLPTTNLGRVIKREPWASVPPIGPRLHEADTMTFERIREIESAPVCPVPWCVDDLVPREYGPLAAETAGHIHMHRGEQHAVPLRYFERNHEDVETRVYTETAYVHLNRFDDDDPNNPTVGQTQVFVEFTGQDAIDPSDLLHLTDVVAAHAHIALESRERTQVTGRHAAPVPVQTNTCYLPWCATCEVRTDHDIAEGDYGHMHIGQGVEVAATGVVLTDRTTIKVELERYDYDSDDNPDGPTTGDTRVYMNVGTNGTYTDGELLTLEQAEELVGAFQNAIRAGRAHGHLINPNRVTPERIAAAVIADTQWRAELDADEQQEADEKAERIALSNRRGAAYGRGLLAGESRLGRLCPRTMAMLHRRFDRRLTDQVEKTSFSSGLVDGALSTYRRRIAK